MDEALDIRFMTDEQNRHIAEAVKREQPRLRSFIRKRILDEEEAEDILQDVFYELVQAYRLMQPVEKVGAWLFRVARNRIIDRWRQRRSGTAGVSAPAPADAAERSSWEDLLPSRDAGPEAAFARGILVEELAAALDELPAEQRAVFVAHEIEGQSFSEIAKETGVSLNTLLSRKHYAVLYLRERLSAIHEEFKNT